MPHNTSRQTDLPVLLLIPFGDTPWVNFGLAPVGKPNAARLLINNPTDEEQALDMPDFPPGFTITSSTTDDVDPASSIHIAPASTVVLQLAWTPTHAARVREVVTLQWRNHSPLQVVLYGAAVGGAAVDGGVVAAKGRQAAARRTPSSRPHRETLRAVDSNTTHSENTMCTSNKTGVVAQHTASIYTVSTSKTAAVHTHAMHTRGLTPSSSSMKPSRMTPGGGGGGAHTRSAAQVGGSMATGPLLKRPRLVNHHHQQQQQQQQQQHHHHQQQQHQQQEVSIKPPSTPTAMSTFTFFHTSLCNAKQQRAYCAWLNHLLQPPATEPPPSPPTLAHPTVSAASPLPAALADSQAPSTPHNTTPPPASGGPTQSLVQLHTLARVRAQLYKVYKGDAGFVLAMLKVHERVASGMIRVQNARGKLHDVKLRAQLLRLLTAYHPFWLRLGLEIVLGMSLPGCEASRVDAVVQEYFLSQPQQQQPQQQQQSHQHRQKGTSTTTATTMQRLQTDKHWDALGQCIVQRTLLLILLLDRGATLLETSESLPLLFRPTSGIKSSAQLLEAFFHLWLESEGDVRRLALLGYRVHYTQTPQQEYDLTFNNLQIDLRDGMRLCKLAELLTGKKGVMAGARVPAVSRVHHMANVAAALRVLQNSGLDLMDVETSRGTKEPIRADDIADGDPDITLALVWRLVLHFQISQLVQTHAMRVEIARLSQIKPSMHTILTTTTTNTTSTTATTTTSFIARIQAQHPGIMVGPGAQHVELLCTWVEAVCARYKHTLSDLSSSFADGRALCYLVHAYIPHALPFSSIVAPAATRAMGPGTPDSFTETQLVALQPSVAGNFALLDSALSHVGGIPRDVIDGPSDWVTRGPDAHAVLLLLAYMAPRLLEASREERAAMVLQRAWRRRMAGWPGSARAHLHMWIAAATVIQQYTRGWAARTHTHRLRAQQHVTWHAALVIQTTWRGFAARAAFLRAQQAAVVVQAAWRGRAACRAVWETHTLPQILHQAAQRYAMQAASVHAARCDAAACVIQAVWRGWVVRREVDTMHHAAVVVQAAWRGCIARLRFLEVVGAVVRVQAAWRRRVAMQMLARHKAAQIIQAAVRGHAVRTQLALHHVAAACIQTAWRAWRARSQYHTVRAAVITVQAAYRGSRQRAVFMQQCMASLTIQRHWRGTLVRTTLTAQQEAAVTIQAAWKAHGQRTRYVTMRRAAVVIQAAVRMQRHRGHLHQAQQAATIIQSAWRMHTARYQFHTQRSAAVTIQATWRAHVQHTRYITCKAAAVVMQAMWRGRQVRGTLERQHAAAIVVQRHVRGWTTRRWLAATHTAIRCIQKHWRGALQRKRLGTATAAAVRVQAAWRGHRTRAVLAKQQAAACTIQAVWRGVRVRREVARQRAAVVVIQRYAVGFIKRIRERNAMALHHAAKQLARAARQYSRRMAAATRIQAMWRGYIVRKQWREVWEAHCAAVNARRAARARAMLTIGALARVAVQRRAFVKIKTATVCIQRRWRQVLATRTSAVITIQAAWRGAVVRRMIHQQTTAAVTIQAAWRGALVRKHAGQPAHRLRRRLAAATARATPEHTLCVRVKWALDVVTTGHPAGQLLQACQVLQRCTRDSYACRAQVLASEDGVAGLLRVVRECRRTVVQQADLVGACLSTVQYVLSSSSSRGGKNTTGESIAGGNVSCGVGVHTATLCGALELLADLLQALRDKYELFMPTARVMQQVAVVVGATALEVGPAAKHTEAVGQLLARRVDTERRYITKLEREKASDANAKEATRKLVATTAQLAALNECLKGMGAPLVPMPPAPQWDDTFQGSHHHTGSHNNNSLVSHPIKESWQPKNTLVRETLRGMGGAPGGGGRMPLQDANR